ncbi:hypothetical protein ACVINY_004025 [Sinorhizobium meliloti]
MLQERISNSLLGSESPRLNVRPYSRIFPLCLDTPHVPFIRNENGREPDDPLSPSTTNLAAVEAEDWKKALLTAASAGSDH